MSSTTEKSQNADVCVVGLGYVGLTLATAFADAGLKVAGVERDSGIVTAVASGRTTFHETGLEAVLARAVAGGALVAVTTAEPLPRADAYIITVGTPLRGGIVWLEDLKAALESVAGGMPDGALVVLRSTVRIGTTRSIAKPILAASGKPFRLAMAPERTVEGKALLELESLPQVVGGLDEASADAAARLFEHLGVEIVRVSSPEAAELAKLASNTYRDVLFAYANELAYVADHVNVDVYEVIHACNHGYERMSVARPGPVAGPCLEKDAYILSDSAVRHGTTAALSMQGRETNERLVSHVCVLAERALASAPSAIAIVGLAFKGRPETSDVRGSLAGPLGDAFAEAWPGVEILGWDPLVSEADAASIGIAWRSLEEALRDASLVVIQTNLKEFSTLEFAQKLGSFIREGATVIDLWNQLMEPEMGRPDVKVVTFGRSASLLGKN